MDIIKRGEKKSDVKWKQQQSAKSTTSTGSTNSSGVRPRKRFGGPFNFRSGKLNSKLLTAVHEGAVVDVQECIDDGVDLSKPGAAGNILRLACEKGNFEVIETLLRGGASHSMLADDNSDAIYVAARRGSPQIVALLISQGARVNGTTRFEQRTPLHAATMQGSSDVVTLLLSSGADVNKADIYGGTALHLAARAGNHAVVEALVLNGADVNLADNEGWTALHLAAESGQTDVVRLLLGQRAVIDCQNRYGRTPLHWACASNQADVVRLLLQHGANYAVVDAHGKHPDAYVVSMNVLDTLKAHTKTNDDQSSNYAGSVGLLMQIDRKMFVDRLHSVPGGHGPRSRSLDDDAGLPRSFETAYRGTRASLDLLPTLEESSVDNSASLKDEPETVAEVFKTFKKLNDSVNRNIEQLQTATRSLAHHVSGASESAASEKSTELLRNAFTRTQHVQHLLDDFGVEYAAMSRLVSWSVDELRRDHCNRDCASGRSIIARCFFHVVTRFLVRQSFGWQKLVRQMSPNDKQSDAIVANIEAGNYETGFRANAALIEWTKRRDGSASALCIKTLLEMLSSCTFGETTDEIVKEFATFMMAQIGKKEEDHPDDQILALVAEKLGTHWQAFFESLGVPLDRLIEARHEVPCVPHQRNRRLILEWKQNCKQSAIAMFTMLIGQLIDTGLEELLAILFPMNTSYAYPVLADECPSTVGPVETSTPELAKKCPSTDGQSEASTAELGDRCHPSTDVEPSVATLNLHGDDQRSEHEC